MVHVEVRDQYSRNIIHRHSSGELREFGQSLLRILADVGSTVQQHMKTVHREEKATLADTLTRAKDSHLDPFAHSIEENYNK